MKGTIAGAMVPFSVIGSGDAMILGIGSDIIHIPRVARAIQNPRFLARVYTAGEPDALGAPQVHLSGYLAGRAEEMAIDRVWITLSHERDYATAYCILEGQR